MTKADLLSCLQGLRRDEEVQWLLKLGAALTIGARSCYEVGTDQAHGPGLRGFNEMQNRLFSRIHHVQQGDAWPL